MRVFRDLQGRLFIVIRGPHPAVTWLVQHAADCISMYHVGEDGKTGYERLKGTLCSSPTEEFGEKFHFKKSAKGQNAHKRDKKCNEGYFLGFRWWTSDAFVGTRGGLSQSRQNQELDHIGDGMRVVSTQFVVCFESGAEFLVRHLTDDAKQRLSDLVLHAGSRITCRMRLARNDFVERSFTEVC